LDPVLSVTAAADTTLANKGEYFTTADYVVRAAGAVRVASGEERSADNGRHGFPDVWRLSQNYPNPFNSGTTIEYAVPIDGHIEIVIVDVLGRTVRSLYAGEQREGQHRVFWDGSDEKGAPAPSGLYLYRMTGGGAAEIRKLLLLR